ncbi:MAG: hypothetical protein EOP47_15630 [Sphingobacteriaceae bacterium]|nr:MAG: hypothetical protein EOP47_15630 [Sphingobacteriaceae bacterium]
MLKLLLYSLLILAATNGFAQTIDSLTQPSPVKTLTLKQYIALQNGDDLYNMAQSGALNHYPLPGNVLKFKKELDLSPVQTTKLTTIDTELLRKKKEMGVFIIRNEKAIDSLFRTRKANDGKVIFYTNRYGIYQGELRNAILQACLSTQKLLTPKQITMFERLYYKY